MSSTVEFPRFPLVTGTLAGVPPPVLFSTSKVLLELAGSRFPAATERPNVAFSGLVSGRPLNLLQSYTMNGALSNRI